MKQHFQADRFIPLSLHDTSQRIVSHFPEEIYGRVARGSPFVVRSYPHVKMHFTAIQFPTHSFDIYN
jgi:hypothetical protein